MTLEQIQNAHSQVKSGADFPAYIQAIKALGVSHYEAYVSDGHTDYHGTNNEKVTSPVKYDAIQIAEVVNEVVFKAELLAHQQGRTDYLTFIRMCGETGIEKWEIKLSEMTCTYFDRAGKMVLEEKIPGGE